jgi:hypothetical protein
MPHQAPCVSECLFLSYAGQILHLLFFTVDGWGKIIGAAKKEAAFIYTASRGKNDLSLRRTIA